MSSTLARSGEETSSEETTSHSGTTSSAIHGPEIRGLNIDDLKAAQEEDPDLLASSAAAVAAAAREDRDGVIVDPEPIYRDFDSEEDKARADNQQTAADSTKCSSKTTSPDPSATSSALGAEFLDGIERTRRRVDMLEQAVGQLQGELKKWKLGAAMVAACAILAAAITVKGKLSTA